MKKSLAILFAGQSTPATLLDGTTVAVFVRALPERYLDDVLANAEWKPPMIELCTYFKLDPDAPVPPPEDQLEVSFPHVKPPAGFQAVPKGWADNLSDESVKELSELAEKLNFQRAATWARGQIAAKKMVAPLLEASMAQVQPLIDKVMLPLMRKLDALLSSTPKSPSSADTPASSS